MQLSQKVWRMESTKGSAAYLILAANGYTLIDTGFFTAGRAIINELNRMQVTSLAQILLTHHDVDHIGNMSLLQRKYNCPVYINSLDIPYIHGSKKRRSCTKKMFDFFIKTDVSAALSALENAAFADITAIHTPGHTPGHSCFIFEDFLFTGDFFRLPRLRLKPPKKRTNWYTAKIESDIRSAIGLPFKWICPAHFVPTRIY